MNLVNKNWKRFSLVRIVEKKSIKGKLGLRFYYELSANETLDLGFIFLENKLLINHITLRPRGWRGMVKEKA